jgi:hypothetical protein
MRSSKIVATIFVLLTILVAGATLMSPMPLVESVPMAQILTVTLLLTGGAVLFFMHLKDFRRQLRRAYLLIGVGLLLVVAGAWQFAILSIMGAGDSAWVRLGAAELPFFIATVLTYMGVRIFARLVGARSSALRIEVVAASTIGVGLLAVTGVSVAGLSNSPAEYLLAVTQGVVALYAALLVYRSRQVTSAFYHPALTWLMWYCLVTVIVGVLTLATLSLPADHWYITYTLGNIPYVFNGLFAMLSAFAFARVATAEKTMHSVARLNTGQQERSVDVVLFLASLVSSPSSIDSLLDPMRALTASVDPKAALTPEQQTAMARVFLALEDYLVNEEPVRAYHQEDLRERVELRFKNTVNEPMFWKQVLGS